MLIFLHIFDRLKQVTQLGSVRVCLFPYCYFFTFPLFGVGMENSSHCAASLWPLDEKGTSFPPLASSIYWTFSPLLFLLKVCHMTKT